MATVFKLRNGKYVDANNNEVEAPKAAKKSAPKAAKQEKEKESE